jgi:hypothetical protein
LASATYLKDMIRPFLIEVSLFLAPFVAYAIFVWATRAGVLDPKAWSLPVLGWLVFAAFALMIVSFVLMAQFGGAPPYSKYVPAHMENGRLVPGTTQ